MKMSHRAEVSVILTASELYICEIEHCIFTEFCRSNNFIFKFKSTSYETHKCFEIRAVACHNFRFGIRVELLLAIDVKCWKFKGYHENVDQKENSHDDVETDRI